jgi:hypothetical protein
MVKTESCPCVWVILSMADLSFGDPLHPKSERRAAASLCLVLVRKPEIARNL